MRIIPCVSQAWDILLAGIGSRAFRRFTVSLLVLAIGASATPSWGVSVSLAEERAGTLLHSVSGDLMMETIRDLEGFGSRAFTLSSNEEIASYVLGRFVELGLSAEMQWFMAGGHSVANVVAWIDGKDEGAPQLLVGAHYDSENQYASNLAETASMPAPGADDDASGVAAVLEMARVMSQFRPGVTVKFAAFGAEENGFDRSGGLAGSRHFAFSEADAGVRYKGTAILDMIGYRAGEANLAILVTNSEKDLFATATKGAGAEHGLDLQLSLVVEPKIKYSDHASFWLAGYPSMLVVEELDGETYFPINPYYHSEEDTSEKLSIDQVVEVTKAVLGGLLVLAEPDGVSANTIAVLGAAAAVSGGALVLVLTRKRKRTVDER